MALWRSYSRACEDTAGRPSPDAGRSIFSAFLEDLAEGLIAAKAQGTNVLLTAFGPAPLSRVVAEGSAFRASEPISSHRCPPGRARCPARRSRAISGRRATSQIKSLHGATDHAD